MSNIFSDILVAIMIFAFGIAFDAIFRKDIKTVTISGVAGLFLLGVSLVAFFVPSIDIKSIPGDATVYLDGEKLGPANKSYSTSFGPHSLCLSVDGSPFHEQHRRKIFVIKTFNDKIFIDRRKGSLIVKIKSDVAYLNNTKPVVRLIGPNNYSRTLNKTPYLFNDIEAGRYVIIVKAGKIEKQRSDIILLGGAEQKTVDFEMD